MPRVKPISSSRPSLQSGKMQSMRSDDSEDVETTRSRLPRRRWLRRALKSTIHSLGQKTLKWMIQTPTNTKQTLGMSYLRFSTDFKNITGPEK